MKKTILAAMLFCANQSYALQMDTIAPVVAESQDTEYELTIERADSRAAKSILEKHFGYEMAETANEFVKARPGNNLGLVPEAI